MPAPAIKPFTAQQGLTIVEVTVTLIVMSLMLASFGIATSAVLDAREAARQKQALTRDAALAMQRMVTAVGETPRLTLPLADNPASIRNEAIREQRVPPETGKEWQTAVLAVGLSPTIDRNADGIADADNDGDGRIDEDPGQDTSFDFAPGIVGIDDDYDGQIDEGLVVFANNDDEDQSADEDPHGSGDEDIDSAIDEDPPGDLNNDNAPGIAGFDDDSDGLIDEGSNADDDEDGAVDEDWYDQVVFYLAGSELIERQAVPNDLTNNGSASGLDFIEVVLAEKVSRFRVERIVRPGTRTVLVDITLELSDSSGESVNLNTRVRVGDSS